MEHIIFLLSTLTYWHWLALGTLLLILELLISSSGFLLWLASASFMVSALTWILPSLYGSLQLIIFSAIAIISLIIGLKYKQYCRPAAVESTLNRRAEQFINRIFILSTPIIHGKGSIYANDTHWQIAGDEMPAGTKVRVTNVDGMILQVQKVEP